MNAVVVLSMVAPWQAGKADSFALRTPSPNSNLRSTSAAGGLDIGPSSLRSFTWQAPDLIFADGFESGTLSAWTAATTDVGDLAVSSAAAIAGGFGMQAVIDDNTAIYVTDDTPATVSRYRARSQP